MDMSIMNGLTESLGSARTSSSDLRRACNLNAQNIGLLMLVRV